MIDSYKFGKMSVNGKEYASDLIIFEDELVTSNWWRKKGHEICVEDIKSFIEQYKPATIIFGTGKFGLVKILAETKAFLTAHNIKLIAEKTGNAYVTFNDLQPTGNVMGGFHLTC